MGSPINNDGMMPSKGWMCVGSVCGALQRSRAKGKPGEEVDHLASLVIRRSRFTQVCITTFKWIQESLVYAKHCASSPNRWDEGGPSRSPYNPINTRHPLLHQPGRLREPSVRLHGSNEQ